MSASIGYPLHFSEERLFFALALQACLRLRLYSGKLLHIFAGLFCHLLPALLHPLAEGPNIRMDNVTHLERPNLLQRPSNRRKRDTSLYGERSIVPPLHHLQLTIAAPVTTGRSIVTMFLRWC